MELGYYKLSYPSIFQGKIKYKTQNQSGIHKEKKRFRRKIF